MVYSRIFHLTVTNLWESLPNPEPLVVAAGKHNRLSSCQSRGAAWEKTRSTIVINMIVLKVCDRISWIGLMSKYSHSWDAAAQNPNKREDTVIGCQSRSG